MINLLGELIKEAHEPMEVKHVLHFLALFVDRADDFVSIGRVQPIWRVVRLRVIVPVLRFAVVVCLIMLVMVAAEKVFMGLVCFLVKVFRRRPRKVYRWEAIGKDEELGSLAYPTVLVQVPLYNEKEVYQVAIRAACGLSWPSDRLIVQVLDDSTDQVIKDLVKKECEKWFEKGVTIYVETRDNRRGYKAGALKEGMKCSYVQNCDYVAIFDADHQPKSDFLEETIPYLLHNPCIALVQARWKFVNADECLMTRIQEMSMDFHFKVAQEAGSSTSAFFGFNGTAGVWRILAINEAGGWNDRTTVEDMDLAVRASLRGWKFVYDGSIKVSSELPSTFKAYRLQQHRWTCGPANLSRKIAFDILVAEKVSVWKKFYLIYNFFIVRAFVSHHVTFLFYTIVIPVCIFFPEVVIPRWGMIYVPILITILCSLGTPSSIHLVPFKILFEQAMSYHRFKAVYIGLFDAGRANEWVVTEKLGGMPKAKPDANTIKKLQTKFWGRMNFGELWIGLFLLICATYDCIYRMNNFFFLFLFPQSLAFFILGFGFVGT